MNKPLLALGACLFSMPVWATSIGIGAATTHGTTEASNNHTGPDADDDDGRFFIAANFGARSRVFNWRMSLSEIDGEEKYDDGIRVNYDGVGWTNTAHFRLIGDDIFRLWLGPSLDIAWLEDDNGTDASQVTFGPVLGLDWALPGSDLSFGLELGAQYGTRSIENNNVNFNDSYNEDIRTVRFRAGIYFGK